ncbi:MAG: ATP-binding protein [Polyangia bacterium]
MIERNLETQVRDSASQYPVVTVTGPRQSGKTTLCKRVFPQKRYVSFEQMEQRLYATEDPRGFLDDHRDGAILDEVQHVPGLLGYLQTEVDERPEPGRWVLTGSQHLGLSQNVSQSLAGRTAVLRLLPCSIDELGRFDEAPGDLFATLWFGGYPRIHDRRIPPSRWLADYVTTYVQRDVRQLLNVGDLTTFTTFVRLCSGRTARTVNTSALAADCGISHNTARAWLSVLEASFLVFRVPPLHANLRKQLIKSPKLHFIDSGLVCNLLGIDSPEQLRHHPLRGQIFESWVVSEAYKHSLHRGLEPRLHHYRERKGTEVDLVADRGGRVVLTEIKSGMTVSSRFFDSISKLERALAEGETIAQRGVEKRLVYGGDQRQRRSAALVIPWAEVAEHDW